jgi:hypothetical protein
MRFSLFAIPFLSAVSFAMISPAAEITVESGPARTNLLELFTSEGCSSCPPAESWFSSLRESPRLWKDIVPIAFHVDYWDSLGWPDPLASKSYTDRQQRYAAAWGANSVYTPGFVLDGKEWRARDLDSIPASKAETGRLSATVSDNGDVRISFHPSSGTGAKWEAHAALLGFGIRSNVRAGENSGRTLVHDFAVLSIEAAPMGGDSPGAVLHLPAGQIKHAQTALAVWITEAGGIEPVQAAGGYL